MPIKPTAIQPTGSTLWPRFLTERETAVAWNSANAVAKCKKHRGRCNEINGTRAKHARGKIILTTSQVCHSKKCSRRTHSRAMCQLAIWSITRAARSEDCGMVMR
jgi:hypothetical protein